MPNIESMSLFFTINKILIFYMYIPFTYSELYKTDNALILCASVISNNTSSSLLLFIE